MRTVNNCGAAGVLAPLAFGVLAGQPAAAQQQDELLEEIIVTARLRDERLIDAPVAVTAFTRADLEGRKLADVSELARFTPNVEFDFTTPISGSTNSAAAFIRGVGQTDYVPSKDPGVGIYLDGIYLSRSVGSVLNLLDVERVELLRGPQGTLFGKNTVGGAINVVTAKPGNSFAGTIDVTFGRYDRSDVRASVDTPLTDTLSARWSLGYFHRDGYMRRVLAGDRSGNDAEQAARVALRWAPTSGFSADITVDYSKAQEQSTASKLLSTDVRVPLSPYSIGDPDSVFAGQAYNVLIGGPDFGASTLFPFLPPLPPDTVPYDRRWLTDSALTTNATGPNYSAHSVIGTSATLTWSLPSLIVKSISGYRDMDSSFGRDPDGSPLVVGESEIWLRHRQFSEELRFSGAAQDKRLSWIGGLYYLTETGAQRDLVPFVDETFRIYDTLGIEIENFLRINGSFSEHSIDSFAVYGHAAFALTERLELAAGLRWTDERRGTISNLTQGGLPTVANPSAHLGVNESTVSISVKYAWTAAVMSYVRYAEGFKSGGFNHRIARPDPNTQLDAPTRFTPEYVASYEAGLKLALAARLRLNAALFRSRYRNIQVLVFDSGAPRTINAAAGDINGAEIEIDAAINDSWRANLAYGYLDAHYTRLDDTVTGALGTPIEMPLTFGMAFVNSPEHTLALGAEGAFRPRAWPQMQFRVDATYRSEIANDAVNTPELIQDGLWLLSASLAMTPDRCQCEIALFGSNLTDERYIASGAADSTTSGTAEAIVARPREWGLRVRYHFE